MTSRLSRQGRTEWEQLRARVQATVGRAQGGRELGARAHIEFLEDVGEMGLDGAAGDVELLGDLGLLWPWAARVATRRSVGVSASTPVNAVRRGAGAGRRSSSRARRASRRRPPRSARSRARRSGARAAGGRLRGAARRRERRGRGCAQAAPGTRQHGDGVFEPVEGSAGGGRACGEGAQAGAVGSRVPGRGASSTCSSASELGLGRVVKGGERMGVVHAPGRQGRVADVDWGQRAARREVGVGVGGAVLGEPQPRPAFQEHRCGEGSAGRSPSWPAAASAASAAPSSSASVRASTSGCSAHSRAGGGLLAA